LSYIRAAGAEICIGVCIKQIDEIRRGVVDGRSVGRLPLIAVVSGKYA
jgi:hypothetical protein